MSASRHSVNTYKAEIGFAASRQPPSLFPEARTLITGDDQLITMLSCTRSLIWGGLLALAGLTAASPVANGPLPIAIRHTPSSPSSFEHRDYNSSSLSTVVPLPPTIQQDLATLLSPSALVLLPSSPSFTQYTHRWSLNTHTNSPSYGVIVIPASERDVSLTIQYANTHSIPFLATTGTHGTWQGLSQLQGGMAIWTRNLTKMEFAADGHSATLGGGLRGNDVIPALWARGKQTTTGSCRCVSLLGPALGGGHGWLQGQYGLGADQILSARVVLANGTAVKTSNTENSDLFWALRGAGHNFGVVTEVEYKLYDAVRPEWSYQSFTFTQDRLEEVYRVHNAVMRNQSQYVVYWSLWRLVPEVDPVNPILVSTVYYNGPASEAASYFAPFAALSPLQTTPVQTTDYPGLAAAAQFRVTDWACQPKAGATVYGMDVDSYDVKGLRKSYNAFRDMIRAEPALSLSMAYLEGYSLQAVQAVPYESTAFALRDRKLLYGFLVTYEETERNKTLDAQAQKWGEKIRDAAYGDKVKQKSVYVNYAKGSESLQAMYGYEGWRQERLKMLKRKYDPKGKFSFYAPIKA
ncbi:FAD-binding domain-containing protein [Neurospora tetrasperma FGSC 2509]|nr:FAD-binding domain-containing protein [Neurospora tetrasperma FGSC 2509]